MLKIKKLILYVILVIVGANLPFAFSNAELNESKQIAKKSNINSSDSDELHKVSITNEAEYAEFQKQRALANRASSSSSSVPYTNSSYSNKSEINAKSLRQ